MPKKILVLSVDRDDDIGRKTRYRGPVIGREENIRMATALALSDPEEPDANAVFEAVKLADMMKDEGVVQVATLTGHKDRGVKSDLEISRQLEKVLEKFPAQGIVFVSDGVEDERVLPIIQSRIKVLSVRRVIVKQSERLEGMYHMVRTFIRDNLDDPRMARIMLGLPAIALLLFTFLDVAGWRIIMGTVAAYLLIKGFQLENYVNYGINEVKTSFTKLKVSFFMYIVAFALAVVAFARGYDTMVLLKAGSWYGQTAAFIYGSVYIFFLSEIIAWVAWLILHPNKYARSLPIPILGFSTAFVLNSASEAILRPEAGFFTLFLSILLGFLLIVTTLTLERKK